LGELAKGELVQRDFYLWKHIDVDQFSLTFTTLDSLWGHLHLAVGNNIVFDVVFLLAIGILFDQIQEFGCIQLEGIGDITSWPTASFAANRREFPLLLIRAGF